MLSGVEIRAASFHEPSVLSHASWRHSWADAGFVCKVLYLLWPDHLHTMHERNITDEFGLAPNHQHASCGCPPGVVSASHCVVGVPALRVAPGRGADLLLRCCDKSAGVDAWPLRCELGTWSDCAGLQRRHACWLMHISADGLHTETTTYRGKGVSAPVLLRTDPEAAPIPQRHPLALEP